MESHQLRSAIPERSQAIPSDGREMLEWSKWSWPGVPNRDEYNTLICQTNSVPNCVPADDQIQLFRLFSNHISNWCLNFINPWTNPYLLQTTKMYLLSDAHIRSFHTLCLRLFLPTSNVWRVYLAMYIFFISDMHISYMHEWYRH